MTLKQILILLPVIVDLIKELSPYLKQLYPDARPFILTLIKNPESKIDDKFLEISDKLFEFGGE